MHEIIEGLVGKYESGSISRRDLILGLAGVFAMGGPAAAQPRRALSVEGMNHVSLFVSDLDRSVDFYQKLLGLEIKSRQQGGVNLALNTGNQFLGIYEVPSVAPRIDHVCLSMQAFDPDGVMAALNQNGVEGRVRMRGDTPELYFTDPDGLSIQLQDVTYCGGSGPLGAGC